MARKKDYRSLKKKLNKIHSFSFRMPREGREFSPQQKSVLTRLRNKYQSELRAIEKDKAQVISKSRAKRIKNLPDNVTKIGDKYLVPKAPGQRIKRTKNFQLENRDAGRTELFVPYDGEQPLDIFIDEQLKKYESRGFNRYSLSINGYRGKASYSTVVASMDSRAEMDSSIKSYDKKKSVVDVVDGIWLMKLTGRNGPKKEITRRDYKNGKKKKPSSYRL